VTQAEFVLGKGNRQDAPGEILLRRAGRAGISQGRQGRQARRQVRNFPLPGHGKGKGLAFASPRLSLGSKSAVHGAMTVQKSPRDRNIVPLIFILALFHKPISSLAPVVELSLQIN
jgi:hypothetical protein